MTSHADILDVPERLSRPLIGSVVLHVSVAAVMLGYTWAGSRSAEHWGDVHGGGGVGSVVTVKAVIKLPSRDAPQNPVANDTDSHVPEAPAKKKLEQKAKAPEPDAIPIKSRNAARRASDRASSQANKWREQQQDRPNQLYSTTGQALSSPMIGMQGGGGPQFGNDSPFGTQFGAYAKLLRDAVARHGSTCDFDSRLSIPAAVVTFTIRRDGSLAPDSVRLTDRSGNSALDISAQRAVMDAAPFPPLPAQFSKNEAQVELRFNLK